MLSLSQILIILDEEWGGGGGCGTWAGCLTQFLRVATGLDMVPEDFCFGFEELVILKKISLHLNAITYNASFI